MDADEFLSTVQQPSQASAEPQSGSADAFLNSIGQLSDTEYVQRSQSAGIAAERTPEEQAAILRRRGLSESAIKIQVEHYKVDQAYRNLGRFEGGKETVAGSILHQVREHFIPFRSWFVNPEQDEADAMKRFQEGKATDADIQLLARARRKREDEQKLHETVAGQIISAARDAPAIMGEYMVGAGVLGKTGILQGERVTSFGKLLSGSGRTAIMTAAMPSMYMEDARQKNLANGRDPNDWRGLPPAGLHAFAQMLVLGNVFKGAATSAPGLVAGTKAAAKGGLAGGVEMALADSATHLADLVMPQAYKISSGDGTFEHLLKGDVSAAARKFAVDATTLAMFAGVHRLADGLSPSEAAKKAKEVLETVKDLPPEEVNRLKEWVKSGGDTSGPWSAVMKRANDVMRRKGDTDTPFFPPEPDVARPEEGLPIELWNRDKVSSEQPFWPERSQLAGEVPFFPPESSRAPTVKAKAKPPAEPNINPKEPTFPSEEGRRGGEPPEPPPEPTPKGPKPPEPPPATPEAKYEREPQGGSVPRPGVYRHPSGKEFTAEQTAQNAHKAAKQQGATDNEATLYAEHVYERINAGNMPESFSAFKKASEAAKPSPVVPEARTPETAPEPTTVAERPPEAKPEPHSGNVAERVQSLQELGLSNPLSPELRPEAIHKTLAELTGKMSDAEVKALAKELTGSSGRDRNGALKLIHDDITGARRTLLGMAQAEGVRPDLAAEVEKYGVPKFQPELIQGKPTKPAPKRPAGEKPKAKSPKAKAAREAIEIAEDNAGPDATIDRLGSSLASVWAQLVRKGDHKAAAEVEQHIRDTIPGIEKIGEIGETQAFNGYNHVATTGVSTDKPVTIKMPGWKLVAGDKQIMLRQAEVEPNKTTTKSEPPGGMTREQALDMWRSMDLADRRNAPAALRRQVRDLIGEKEFNKLPPEEGERLSRVGGEGESVAKKPTGMTEGPQEIHPILSDLIKSSPLNAGERNLITRRLEGESLESLAKKRGVTKQAMAKREAAALAKFREFLKPKFEAMGLDPAQAEKLSAAEMNERLIAADAGDRSFLRNAFGLDRLSGVHQGVNDAIDKIPGMEEVAKEHYRRAVAPILERMTPTALKKIGKYLGNIHVFASGKEVGEAVMSDFLRDHAHESPEVLERFHEELRQYQSGEAVLGGAVYNGKLYIDGGIFGGQLMRGMYGSESGFVSVRSVWAHEMGHMLDYQPDGSSLSEHRDWVKIWEKEINKQHGKQWALTEYAGTSASEGFAEFHRILHEGLVRAEQIKKDFPEAYEFFEDVGLLPKGEEPQAIQTRTADIFAKRVQLDGKEHADNLKRPDQLSEQDGRILTEDRPPAFPKEPQYLRVPTVADVKDFFDRAKNYLLKPDGWYEWAKNELTGKIGSPPGVRIDRSNVLPRMQNQNELKDIASEAQGVGRTPFFRWLFDPVRADATEEGKVFTANQVGRELGKDVAAVWALREREADNLFGADETGTYLRGDGTRGRMSDDIEAHMRGEKTGLSPEQKAWVDSTWTPLLRDAQKMMKEEGIAEWVDDMGNPISQNAKAYFPRIAIGKRGVEGGAGPGTSARPGAKAHFEKSRDYKTEDEGANSDEKVIYDPSAKSRVAKFIANLYRAVADHRMANDPALKGETVNERFDALKAANTARLRGLTGKAKEDALKELHERAANPTWLKERFAQAGAAFAGKIYPADIASRIEKAFADEQAGSPLKKIADVSAFAKGIMLGGDFSWAFIQLLPTMFRNPRIWAKSVKEGVKSLFDPERLAKFANVPENAQAMQELPQVGSSVSRLQDFMRGLASGAPVTRIPIIGKLYEATGRAFGTAMDVAKIELWKKYSKLAKPEELRAVAEAIDSMLLTSRMDQIGLSPQRRLVEQLLFLAPSYYRGGTNFMASAFQRGLPGKMVREALGATIAGIVTTAVAGMYAVGLSEDEIEERLNPARGKFLKVPLDLGDGKTVEAGFGNILTSYVRLAGGAADYLSSDKPIDTGADGNPMLRWLRGKAAFAPRLAIDVFTGKDYNGNRIGVTEATARAFEPLVIQQLLHGDAGAIDAGGIPERGTVADAVAGIFGLQAHPGSNTDRKFNLLNAEAYRAFSKPYAALSIPEQARVMKSYERAGIPNPPPTLSQLERATALQTERQQNLTKSLSTESRDKLAAISKSVPFYDATFSYQGTEIPLTHDRLAAYGRYIGEEYDKAIEKWDVERVKKMSAPVQEEFLRRSLTQAKERARDRLIRESQGQ